MTMRYLPLGLMLSAHTATQDSDDPDLLTSMLKLLESAYADGYGDGYTRGVAYKEAQASADRRRRQRHEDKAATSTTAALRSEVEIPRGKS